MRLVKNVAGVDGLHIALDAFGEAAERRLFESQRIHAPQESHGPNSDADGRRAGRCHRPLPDDVDLFRVCNLVGDCGLFPGYVTPDYVYAITYPPKAAFNKHLDSRYRWGETVVGVTLGQAGTVYFEPNTQAIKAAGPPAAAPPDAGEAGGADAFRVRIKHYDESGSFAIELELPRRSVYVMSGAARTLWKHGIRQQKPSSLPPPPPWNPYNMRRALTLRATKAFSDACLQERLRQATDEAERAALRRRIAAQDKFRPQSSAARLNDRDLAELREEGERMRRHVATQRHRHARFPPSELHFPLPESVACGVRAAADSWPPNGGLRLGGAASPLGSVALASEEEELQEAIRASLRAAGAPVATEPGSSGGGGGGGEGDPIELDTSDEEAPLTAAAAAAGSAAAETAGTPGPPAAAAAAAAAAGTKRALEARRAAEEDGDGEEELRRMREARLARLGGA